MALLSSCYRALNTITTCGVKPSKELLSPLYPSNYGSRGVVGSEISKLSGPSGPSFTRELQPGLPPLMVNCWCRSRDKHTHVNQKKTIMISERDNSVRNNVVHRVFQLYKMTTLSPRFYVVANNADYIAVLARSPARPETLRDWVRVIPCLFDCSAESTLRLQILTSNLSPGIERRPRLCLADNFFSYQ